MVRCRRRAPCSGRQAIIGATCYAQSELAEQAVGRGRQVASAASSISSTKPGAPATSVELPIAPGRLHLPITAIGGISLDTAPGLIARGVDLVTVIHALFAAASAPRWNAAPAPSAPRLEPRRLRASPER